jgi:hypothetical protein
VVIVVTEMSNIVYHPKLKRHHFGVSVCLIFRWNEEKGKLTLMDPLDRASLEVGLVSGIVYDDKD